MLDFSVLEATVAVINGAEAIAMRQNNKQKKKINTIRTAQGLRLLEGVFLPATGLNSQSRLDFVAGKRSFQRNI